MNHVVSFQRYGGIKKYFAELWRNLWLTEHRAAQVLVATVSILVSTGIGAAFADTPFINNYQIMFWILAVLVCFAMLYPARGLRLMQFNRTAMALAALVAASFFLRVINLQYFPPGYHVDEAGTIDFSLRHAFNPLNQEETVNPLRTGSDSQPVLYAYVVRLSVALFGFTIAGARLSSVIAGTLAVLAVFFMVNELVGRRVAWLAAILMAVYHYHIHWSRIVLNNIWVTLFLPLTIGFFLYGWRKGWAGGAVWAGLCLGLTAYFYAGGYILIFLLPILIWRTWKQVDDHISLSIYTGKMFALALVVAAPLIVFALLFPDQFLDRSRIIYGWKPLAIQATIGDPTAYWEHFKYQFTRSFGAYNFFPDTAGFYAPRIPFLIGVASILFPLGIAWSIFKRQYFPVLWILIVTFTGGFMLVATPATSHFIGVIPVICWMVATPLNWLIETRRPFWAYLLLALIIALDLYFYFVVYPTHPSRDLVLPFPQVEPYNY